MDICLRVLKESTTNKFDRYNRQEQCIDDIPCYLSGLSRAHFFGYFFRNIFYNIFKTFFSTGFEVTGDCLDWQIQAINPRQYWILDSTLRIRIQGNRFQISCQRNLDSKFQSLARFRIPKPRIPDSTSIKFPAYGFHGQKISRIAESGLLGWNTEALFILSKTEIHIQFTRALF